MNRRVVISGMGCVTPFGVGREAFAAGLRAGRTAAKLIDTFDTSAFPTRFAAPVALSEAELDGLVENQKALKTLPRSGKFAMIALQEAMQEAALDGTQVDPYRFGTCMGAGGLSLNDVDHTLHMTDVTVDHLRRTSSSGPSYGSLWKAILEQTHPLYPLKALSNIPTAHLAIAANARGVCQTVATACTSSAQAVGEAFRQIKHGYADAMIAGGSDSMVNPNGLAAFSLLGVMSTSNDDYRTAARPFDRRRNGFMLGEGSAVFILEEREHCLRRGARPRAEIVGYASTCDAFRLTDEPQEAWGSVAAMQAALREAGMRPEEIGYINAHGTGTLMNDKTETHAIKQVFGDTARRIPVSSTKSMIGHLVAAAGAVELAACVLALRHGFLPPTINYAEPDPDCDLDCVPNDARDAGVDAVLSNSFGFGGQNACLLLRGPERA